MDLSTHMTRSYTLEFGEEDRKALEKILEDVVKRCPQGCAERVFAVDLITKLNPPTAERRSS